MLRRLIHFSLEFRLVVLLTAAVVLVAGGIAAWRAPWDVFPEFAPPQVTVQTEAPGLSAEEVEQLVTVPVESALSGVQDIAVLRSTSIPGLSVVTVIFASGTDLLDARQLIGERLVEVESMLPDRAETPRMAPLKASTSRLIVIGLSSEVASPQELRTLADWTFKRRLLAVPGVAQVEIFGGDVKQYQVLVHPEPLRQYSLTLDDVVRAASSATGFGGAGYIETFNQRLPIRQRTRIESAADLAAAPVAFRDGTTLTLGHVTDVIVGPADKFGDAAVNGRPAVLMAVHKQPGASTLAVTAQVQRVVSELQPGLPDGITLHSALFRQATFIERAIGNLNLAILWGAVFVAAVLIAFLFQWRTVLISLIAIPLSLLGAMLVLRAFGVSLNAMTLGGLAIALGAVVDDAIVDVENVLRRLVENRGRPTPQPAFRVVLEASLEVRSAIVLASFVVILVFVPVFLLEGLAGTLFRSIAFAYVAAILVSLLVAVTVTPAMCLALLGGSAATRAHQPPLVRWLQAGYVRVLPLFLHFSRTTVVMAVGLLIAAGATTAWLGGEFLPDFRESNFIVFMAGRGDTSLTESMRVGQRIADRLQQIKTVESIAQQTGRAELSEDSWGPNLGELAVVIDPQADYETTLAALRERLECVPGFDFQVKQFLRERIDEVLTGSTADVVIKIVGPDLRRLRQLAQDVTGAIRDVPGIEDLQTEKQTDIPQIELLVRPREAGRYGVSVGELNATIQTLLQGRIVGQVYEDQRAVDVVVRAAPQYRDDPATLRELPVDAPQQDRLPLRAVADVAVVDGVNLVNREAGVRRILVTCNAEGRDVSGVMQEIQARVARHLPQLPTGYHIEFGGEYVARQAAQQRLLSAIAIVLVGIFVFLMMDLRSAWLALLVMVSVPLACVGGIAAVFLSGGNVSIGSLVGFVTVFGIAVRNGILLISHYQHLRAEEGATAGRELIVRGAAERLAPVLMTALTTALALVPLVWLGERPGHEIEHPMAVVILGGLISSTFLSLVLLPILYQLSGPSRRGESGRVV